MLWLSCIILTLELVACAAHCWGEEVSTCWRALARLGLSNLAGIVLQLDWKCANLEAGLDRCLRLCLQRVLTQSRRRERLLGHQGCGLPVGAEVDGGEDRRKSGGVALSSLLSPVLSCM